MLLTDRHKTILESLVCLTAEAKTLWHIASWVLWWVIFLNGWSIYDYILLHCFLFELWINNKAILKIYLRQVLLVRQPIRLRADKANLIWSATHTSCTLYKAQDVEEVTWPTCQSPVCSQVHFGLQWADQPWSSTWSLNGQARTWHDQATMWLG